MGPTTIVDLVRALARGLDCTAALALQAVDALSAGVADTVV